MGKGPDKRADTILTLMAEEGLSMSRACKAVKLAPSTFVGWTQSDEALAERYARARDRLLERYADEIVDIADDSGLDIQMTESGPKVDGEAIQRARLRIDSRKWLLCKLRPEQYGERLKVNSKVEQRNFVNEAKARTDTWLKDVLGEIRETRRLERAEQAGQLCALGASDADLAQFFKVKPAEIAAWIEQDDDFYQAVERGRSQAA